MSVAALTYVWENSKQEGGSLLVMLALADYANDRGESFPSVKTLCKKARLGERQTQYVLRQLEAAGEMEVLKNKGPNGVNLYRIKKTSDRGADIAPGGVQSSSPRGAVQFAKGVRPTAPKPSGNRQEPSDSLFPLPSKTKKKKIGTVNGVKPTQLEIEQFCVSIDLPKSDGEIMLLKWQADGWPVNWMDKIRYYKRCGYLHSQKNGHKTGKPEPASDPQGWAEWLKAQPIYLSNLQRSSTGTAYRYAPEFMKLEFTRLTKGKKIETRP